MLLRIAELVNDVLVAAYPGNKLSPEQIIELIDLGSSPGGKAGRHWVLDPIDGTRGFVDRRQYSVCLGMLQDGEVELGVLGCPNLPRAQVTDEVGQSGSAERADPAAVGCLFLAHRCAVRRERERELQRKHGIMTGLFTGPG